MHYSVQHQFVWIYLVEQLHLSISVRIISYFFRKTNKQNKNSVSLHHYLRILASAVYIRQNYC